MAKTTLKGEGYTEQSLAVRCPECTVEAGERCVYRHRGVNKERAKPHYARIVKARIDLVKKS